jgi:hypothetical protein
MHERNLSSYSLFSKLGAENHGRTRFEEKIFAAVKIQASECLGNGWKLRQIHSHVKSKEPYLVAGIAIATATAIMFTLGMLHLRGQTTAMRSALRGGLFKLRQYSMTVTNQSGEKETVFDWMEICRQADRELPSFITPDQILIKTQNVAEGSGQLAVAVDYGSDSQGLFGDGIRRISKREILKFEHEPGVIRANHIELK